MNNKDRKKIGGKERGMKGGRKKENHIWRLKALRFN